MNVGRPNRWVAMRVNLNGELEPGVRGYVCPDCVAGKVVIPEWEPPQSTWRCDSCGERYAGALNCSAAVHAARRYAAALSSGNVPERVVALVDMVRDMCAQLERDVEDVVPEWDDLIGTLNARDWSALETQVMEMLVPKINDLLAGCGSDLRVGWKHLRWFGMWPEEDVQPHLEGMGPGAGGHER